MRSTTLHYITWFWKLCFFAIAFWSFPVLSATTQAQSNIPIVSNSTLNGLFTPTAAQRFFEAGRDDFEREIKFVTNSETYFNGDLLQIDEELLEQIKENESLQKFDLDNLIKKF